MATKGKKTASGKPGIKRALAPKAPPERVGVIELGGKPATVVGKDLRVGQKAPRFKAQVGNWAGLNLWAEVDPLQETAGKVRVLAAVPSLNTTVCQTETRKFNQAAAGLSDEIRVITVSADLPVMQKDWCGKEGIERVAVVSDHMDVGFGVKYGTLIKERRWHRRAVFVVGRDDKVKYAAYMPALGVEPDYDEVLAAARQALAE